MNWRSPKALVCRPGCGKRAKLQLEQLEDRRLLAVTYHGGPLLRSVEVEPVYYGAYWTGPAGQQQAADLTAYLRDLTSNTYLDLLAEYGIGRGQVVDNGFFAGTTSAAGTVDDSTLQQTLDDALANGALPPTDANRLYVVFTAPQVDVTQGGQDSAHNFFGYHDFFTGHLGSPIYYAVIAHPSGNGVFYNLNEFQTLTKTVSHELAEAVTDPGVGGWFDSRTGSEIGDLANGPRDIGLLDGYVVQAEWSAQQRAVALPVGAQPLDASSVTSKPITSTLDTVALAFTHSGEYFADLVQSDYLNLLHRTPSADEVNSWVTLLENGVSDEQVLAGFTSSAEYYQQAGGNDPAWVNALYHDLLGRDADAGGTAVWLQALASGVNRFTVAYGIATSVEHETQMVAAAYQRYLGRSADPSEVAGWMNNLQRGMTAEQLTAAFLASDEFYTSHGSAIQSWLSATYQMVFQRAPDAPGYAHWEGYLEAARFSV